MPDLLTHVIIAQGCRMGIRGGALTPWFLVGTVLPDVLTRPFNIAMPPLFWFFMPLHTPAGFFVVCALVSHFFPAANRPSIFGNLLGGGALHLLLDIFQAHLAGSYYLLFPFSWWSFEFGLFWPEDSLYLLPLWVGGGLLLGTTALMHQYKRNRAPSRQTTARSESCPEKTSRI
jgi:hypothetical protein